MLFVKFSSFLFLIIPLFLSVSCGVKKAPVAPDDSDQKIVEINESTTVSGK